MKLTQNVNYLQIKKEGIVRKYRLVRNAGVRINRFRLYI